jgi:hypothetical protein
MLQLGSFIAGAWIGLNIDQNSYGLWFFYTRPQLNRIGKLNCFTPLSAALG